MTVSDAPPTRPVPAAMIVPIPWLRRRAGRRSAPWAKAVVTLVVALSAMVGTAGAQAPSVDPCAYEGGPTDEEGAPLYNGGDATRHTTLLRPFAVTTYPCLRADDMRAVRVRMGSVELIEGGRLLERVDLPPRDGPLPFEEVAALMEAYSWAVEVEPGVFELSAAVVQAPGTTMSVAAPRVKAVRLLDRPGVFIGGRGATARFEGVTVTSWDPRRAGPDENPEDHRPFVVYEKGSRLEVVGSQMSFLGSDRTYGYGVMWGQGTTGEVADSTFDHNFFGVYTSSARDVAFRRSVFRDNLYYGLNLHTGTRDVLAEDNDAHGNGSHGIVGAGAVVHNVFTRNHSYANWGNGIVMDGGSDRNLIEGNTVEDNAKDGIVVISSSDVVVVGNVVRRHRVGVRVNQRGSDRDAVRDNVIEDSQLGVQAYGGATETTVAGNTVVASSRVALVLDSPGSLVTGGDVRRAPRGLEIRAATRVADVTLVQVEQGLVVTGTGIADVERVDVAAGSRPVRVEPGGTLRVADSTLDGRPAARDRWLPLAGLAAVSVAVSLQMVSRLRHRDRRAVQAPPGVWNTV